MRALAGQAMRGMWFVTHRIISLTLALTLIGLVGTIALSWRLKSGPIELPWLTRQLQAAANTDGGPVRWSIGTASLAWEGFSAELDRPLDIRVTGIVATRADGVVLARLPEASVTFAAREMLRLRLVPRTIELRGAQIRATRSADQGLVLDLGDPTATPDAPDSRAVTDVLADLLKPIRPNQDSPLSQLRRLVVHNASLLLTDRITNTEWSALNVGIDLKRAPEGGAEADITLDAPLGTQKARITGHAVLRDQDDFVTLTARGSEVNPARLAADLPLLARGAPVDVPVSLEINAIFDRALAFRRGEATARLGTGTIAVARGSLPINMASVTLRGTLATATLNDMEVDVPTPSGAVTHIAGSGSLEADAEGYRAELALTLDEILATDLGILWPEGIAGKGTKPWIMKNITAGTATDLHVSLSLRADPTLANLSLTHIAGGLDGNGITIHWLPPVPPIEQAEAQLTFVSPDVIDFTFTSGKQAGLQLSNGLVRISGLSVRDQVADISADIAGPLADVIGILKHPRVRLLDRRPIEMRAPAGEARGRLEIAALPLESWLTVEDVKLRATARLTGVHLGAIAAGRDLDQGVLDLQASNDGLKVQGTAQLAGIPSKLGVEMDFKPGSAAQVVQSVTVNASADAGQLAAIGLDAGDVLKGAVPGTLTWLTRRDGRGEITIKSDLTATELAIDRLSFTKPPGKPAQADIHVQLDRDRITAVDRVQVQGEGIAAEARITFAAGKPTQALVNRLRLGANTDLTADIRFPARDGAPWQINLGGNSIDASAELRHPAPGTPTPATGPPYVIDARLNRAVLGEGRQISQLVLHAENDGRINRQLHVSGRVGTAGPFQIDIAPVLSGRTLTGKADDAGGLLHALDLIDDIQGGAMKLTGRYDDTKADHPLNGTIEITDFRMVKAPALAKLLQAVTFYGLVELMRGPGLGFSRLDTPFHLTGDTLVLDDTRAFNASLGMTAKGRIDIATGRCDLTGTIVPAYFFNSLLGNIPLVGRLFSAERGGGLLAANYSLYGDCNDPDVGVNPLAALTPGFLRGLFGLFDGASTPQPTPPAPIR